MVDNISGNNGNSGDSRNVNNANMINGTGKNAGNARSGRRKDFYGKRNGSDQMAKQRWLFEQERQWKRQLLKLFKR